MYHNIKQKTQQTVGYYSQGVCTLVRISLPLGKVYGARLSEWSSLFFYIDLGLLNMVSGPCHCQTFSASRGVQDRGGGCHATIWDRNLWDPKIDLVGQCIPAMVSLYETIPWWCIGTLSQMPQSSANISPQNIVPLLMSSLAGGPLLQNRDSNCWMMLAVLTQ